MPTSSGFVSVIGFNSAFGAAQFAFNNPTLNPVPVQVPQGFSPPSYGLSGPNPSASLPPQFWVSVTSPTLSGIPSGYNVQFTYDLTNNKVITQRSIDPNTLTITDNQNNPIFQNGQPVTAPTALPDQPPVPYIYNPFAPVEPPNPYTPSLPFDYKAIYDDPDLRKFIQRSQQPPDTAQQAEQFNLETQNLLDQLQQYFNPIDPRQPIADFPSDPNALKNPAIPDIETTPLKPIPLPQTADPWSLEYKGPDPLTMPPYSPLPDLPGEMIQPPRSFDPWDPHLNRPSIKPQAQPISDSGEGGGLPSLQQSYWLIIDVGITENLGSASAYGTGTTVLIPPNSAIASSQITTASITWATFQVSTSGRAPPGPVVINGGSGALSCHGGPWCGAQTFNSFNTGGHNYQSMPPFTTSGNAFVDSSFSGSGVLPGTGTAASADSTSVYFIPPVPGSSSNTGWFSSPLSGTFNFFGDSITSSAIYNSLVGPGNTLFATTNGSDITAHPSLTNNCANNILAFVYDGSSVTATSTGGGITVNYKTVAAGQNQSTADIVFLLQGGPNTINV